MKPIFRKILINTLVLMVVMLPLRNVFAMSMEMSPDHCAVDVEMAMMNHAGLSMPSSDLADSQLNQKISDNTSCNQCDGECSECVHISSAITFGFLQLSNLTITEFISPVTNSLLTRIISPPSRPPLVL